MGINIVSLIVVAMMMGGVYACYLLAFKQEKLNIHFNGKTEKYPPEIKEKVARHYGITGMVLFLLYIVVIFMPESEYTFGLMLFLTIIAMFIMYYGHHLIIKKYDESQKNNDETELK